MINAFVVPDVTRLHLKGGHWIDVKAELTYGEHEDMLGSMRRQFGPGESPQLDPTRIGRCRMAAWIVAWSLVDNTGKPIPVGPSGFSNLKMSMARAIRDAIDLHELAVDEASEAEKNDPDGASVSSPISPSASS
jgi:hypothetical protein